MALILLFVETSNRNCVQVFSYLFRCWINSLMANYKDNTNTRAKQKNYIKTGINKSVMMMMIMIIIIMIISSIRAWNFETLNKEHSPASKQQQCFEHATVCCTSMIQDYVLGAFARFIKANISFMSVRLAVFPHGTTRLPLDGFSW